MLNLHALTRMTQICTLLSLLSGCYNSMYGIPQQEWVRLNEQQKKAVMDDYYAQQRVQQYNQYNAAPNYYPAPVYPAAPNVYYAPPPVYVSPRHPRYSEQHRHREAERRAAEIRAREEFNRHAREKDRRHEHPAYQPRAPIYTNPRPTPTHNNRGDDAHPHERHERTYQPHAPIYTNPHPTPTHNNRGDDALRLPHNTAPSRSIHTPPPAHNSRSCNGGDCKLLAR
ncbi:MAG: hypothetical protein PHP00_00850 [Thiotrichaceae bacterium]|nr:hypothetical protein [Thiotrichaceae bacterium]